MPPTRRGIPKQLKRGALYRALFGESGNQRDLTAWSAWFTAHDPDGFAQQAFDRLVAAGCAPAVLTELLMEIRWTLYLRRMDTPRAMKVGAALRAARRALSDVGDSTLVYHFGLADPFDPSAYGAPAPEWDLVNLYIRWNLEVRPAAARKDNMAFVRAFTNLLCYVKQQTGKFSDPQVDTLMELVVGREFSSKPWRKGHQAEVRAASRRRMEYLEAMRAKRLAEQDWEAGIEDWPPSEASDDEPPETP